MNSTELYFEKILLRKSFPVYLNAHIQHELCELFVFIRGLLIIKILHTDKSFDKWRTHKIEFFFSTTFGFNIIFICTAIVWFACILPHLARELYCQRKNYGGICTKTNRAQILHCIHTSLVKSLSESLIWADIFTHSKKNGHDFSLLCI